MPLIPEDPVLVFDSGPALPLSGVEWDGVLLPASRIQHVLMHAFADMALQILPRLPEAAWLCIPKVSIFTDGGYDP